MSRVPASSPRQALQEFFVGAGLVGLTVLLILLVIKFAIDPMFFVGAFVLSVVIFGMWIVGVAIHAMLGWYDV